MSEPGGSCCAEPAQKHSGNRPRRWHGGWNGDSYASRWMNSGGRERPSGWLNRSQSLRESYKVSESSL